MDNTFAPNLAQVAATQSVKRDVFGVAYMGANELLYNYGPYDSWQFASGTTLDSSYSFFQTALNQVGSGFTRNKTYAETNMLMPGKLGSGINATIQRMYVVATPSGQAAESSTMAAYLTAFMYDTLFEVTVDEKKQIGSRHGAEFSGYGFTGYADQSAAADVALLSLFPTSTVRAMAFHAPFGIPSQTQFQVNLVPNSTNTFIQTVPDGCDFRVQVFLVGTITNIAVN